MKKLFTIVSTATFFAVTCSLIDQFIWNNDFYWLNAAIGFVAGAALVLLGHTKTDKESDHVA